jgi:alcohol dehydrogenase, propanol-preferring
MQALRLFGPGSVALTNVPIPEPTPDEVLVEVSAAGICHSDLVMMDSGTAMRVAPPVTLGHESAGRIVTMGSRVSGWEVGQAVGVFAISGCGHCLSCRSGLPSGCSRGWSSKGVQEDGGLADYMVARPHQLVDATGLDLVQAACLTDAGITAYGAVARALGLLVPGSTAVVVGVGGVGHLAVQILRAITASTVVAVDLSSERLAFAKRHGAGATVLAGSAAAAEIRDLAPEGVDAVFDFVASQDSLDLATATVRSGGLIAITGSGDGILSITKQSGALLPFEASVVKTASGTYEQLREVLALSRAGYLTAEVVEFPLAHVMQALERLRNGTLIGRGVARP